MTTKKKRHARRETSRATPRVQRPRPCRDSQHVEDGVWFYEYPNTLQFVAWTRFEPGKRQVRLFRIRWSKLAKSAERCGWKLTRAAHPTGDAGHE